MKIYTSKKKKKKRTPAIPLPMDTNKRLNVRVVADPNSGCK